VTVEEPVPSLPGFDEVVLLSLHRGTLGKVREAVEAEVD
jgi:hypothetical protein